MRVSLVLAVSLFVLGICQGAGTGGKAPVEGDQNQRYLNLPSTHEATGPFLAPKPGKGVKLPPAVSDIYISVAGLGHSADEWKRVNYFYSGDDTVNDVLKYVSERTGLSLSSLEYLSVKRFDAIGTSMENVTGPLSTALKAVPLAAADELEVHVDDSVDVDSLEIKKAPTVTNQGLDVPGFIDVKVKLAGMPIATLPMPRVATGKVAVAMVADRMFISNYKVQLRRGTRRGRVLLDDELVVDGDAYFFATLTPKDSEDSEGVEEVCCHGSIEVQVSTGASRIMDVVPSTTAQDVLTFLDNLNEIPSADIAPMGMIVSTKGLVNDKKSLDALEPSDRLGQHGLREGGTVYVNVYCPIEIIQFAVNGIQFPQLFNCTGKLHYMNAIFYGISGKVKETPRYYVVKSKNGIESEERLSESMSLLSQIGDSRIVNVKYAGATMISFSTSLSSSPSPSPPAIPVPISSPSPTPSMTMLGDTAYDSVDDRFAKAPAHAVKLGGGIEPVVLLHNKAAKR